MNIKLGNVYIASSLLLLASVNTFAMDTEKFISMANSTIQEANGGFISNINSLIQLQEDLVAMGVAGCKEYMDKHPEQAALLGEVVKNAENMKQMTLEEIEDKWHQGKHMRDAGFDLDSLEHFGDVSSLMDAIIHPATSYIALKEYKRTRNTVFLTRASAELIEVVEHVSHIGKPPHDTKFTENK